MRAFFPIDGSCPNLGRIHIPTRINVLRTIKKLDSANRMESYAEFFLQRDSEFYIAEMALSTRNGCSTGGRLPQQVITDKTGSLSMRTGPQNNDTG